MDEGGPTRRFPSSGGSVAWDRHGAGPPLVLVHGTPASSHLWRRITPRLAERFSVHVWDLLGYGGSEKREGQNVSIAAQARLLADLLEHWDLDAPAVVGHDVGAAIVLRAHLRHGRRFRRIALLDAVAFNPWLTPTTTHIRAHLEHYRAMFLPAFEELVRAHLSTAVHRSMDEETVDAYLAPWRGEEGRAAYLRKIVQVDEGQTAELEPLLGSIRVPVLVIWGERDRWLDPSLGRRLAGAIPEARLVLVPEAGHFVTEDAPEEVAAHLLEFFGDDSA